MAKKVFAIYFSAPGALDYPFNKKVFFEAYAEIIEYLENKGIKVVVVRGDSYMKDGVFKHYFIWNSKTYEKINKEIKVDLIWNRDSENVIPRIDDCEMLNRFEFDEICRDKILTYNLFKEFSAKTFLLNSYKDLEDNIGKINTNKIILKPRFGEQCQGVYAIDKSEIKPDLYKNWENVLLQEFLDSSKGIEGFVDGMHEVNVFMVNGEFSGARVKKPAEGSLISSATGKSIGKVWGVKEKDLPKELLEEIKKLDSKFSDYPLRIFRADFVNTKGGYKLIELNSRPGVMHKDKEGKDFYWDFNGKLVNLILNYFK